MNIEELNAYLMNLKGILESTLQHKERLSENDYFTLKGKLELTRFILGKINKDGA